MLREEGETVFSGDKPLTGYSVLCGSLKCRHGRATLNVGWVYMHIYAMIIIKEETVIFRKKRGQEGGWRMKTVGVEMMEMQN